MQTVLIAILTFWGGCAALTLACILTSAYQKMYDKVQATFGHFRADMFLLVVCILLLISPYIVVAALLGK